MKNKLSNFNTLNSRERFKALYLAVLGALVGLLWSGLEPVVGNFVSTFTVDFSPFLEAVNLTTILKVATAAAGPYLGFTWFSGSKE